MSNDGGEGADEDGAARAFDALRAEVAVMRGAVERLTAERAEHGHGPDYSETLGVISHNLAATAQRVDALVNSPALSLAPEEFERQLVAAGYMARREDQRVLSAAKQGLEEMTARLGRHLQSHALADAQRRQLWQVGLAGLILGMLLWAGLAGPVARAMPASWLWPERMAARSLRLPMWEGGQQLMRAASPASFAGVVAGSRLVAANHDALVACRKQAFKAKKPVRCAIKVE